VFYISNAPQFCTEYCHKTAHFASQRCEFSARTVPTLSSQGSIHLDPDRCNRELIHGCRNRHLGICNPSVALCPTSTLTKEAKPAKGWTYRTEAGYFTPPYLFHAERDVVGWVCGSTAMVTAGVEAAISFACEILSPDGHASLFVCAWPMMTHKEGALQ